MRINLLTLLISAFLITFLLGFVLSYQAKITSLPKPISVSQPAVTSQLYISPTAILTPLGNNFADFIYPNSTIVSSTSNNLVLESTDNANIITNWYKEKIYSLGMRTIVYSQTNTNGNILNKLAGAKGNYKIEVTISKSADQTKTTIQLK